jgi:hypothetical protein
MGYRLLGFAVWQGGKWYFSRRLSGTKRKVVVAGLGAVVGAGVLAATQRQQNGSS